jgi:hypothetical protein
MGTLKPLLYLSAAVFVLGLVIGGNDSIGVILLTGSGISAIGIILVMTTNTLILKHEAGDFQPFLLASRKLYSSVDSWILIKVGAASVVLLVLWMNVYETLPYGVNHRNRITNAVCHIDRSCWF